MRYLVTLIVLLLSSTAFADHRAPVYLLTNADANSLYNGFQTALERSPNQQAFDWHNTVTGLSGSTVPLKSYQTAYGQTCREYLSTVQLNGAIQQAFGAACRQADGDWKIVEEQLIKRAQPALKFVYVKPQRQQIQNRCPYAFKHPPVSYSELMRFYHGDMLRGDGFHEKFKTFRRDRQSMPELRRVEPEQPSKLLKLVAY